MMMMMMMMFVEIGTLWLFHICCSDATIACPLFNLVRNSVVHLPSSVVRDPRYRNVSTRSSCSFWMSMRHAMPSLAIILVLSTLIRRLYLRLTRSRRSTNSCSSASELVNRMMSSAYSEGSWPLTLQLYSSPAPSPLGCWTSTVKGHNLVRLLS